MKLIVKATNLELTPALNAFIEQKFAQIDKFFKKITTKESVLRIEVARTTKHHKKGPVFYAEANLEGFGGMLRATASNWNIRVAVNETKEKLKYEIGQRKEKWQMQRKRGLTEER